MLAYFRSKHIYVAILVGFVLGLFGSTLLARESKQQRRENALAVRRVVSGLYRVGLVSQDSGAAKERYQLLEGQLQRVLAKLEGFQLQKVNQEFNDLKIMINASPINAKEVQNKTQKLIRMMVETFAIEQAPAQIPDFVLGKDLFKARCQLCHGESATAPGALAARLTPKPQNLFNDPIVQEVPPFYIYNIMITGIEKTSKKPIDDLLNNHELWSLAFYVAAIGCDQKNALTGEIDQSLDLKKLAMTANKDFKIKQDSCYYRTILSFQKDIPRVRNP